MVYLSPEHQKEKSIKEPLEDNHFNSEKVDRLIDVVLLLIELVMLCFIPYLEDH